MTEDLLHSLNQNIGLITLNRPELHNAISYSMWQKLPNLFTHLQEQGARVIVITGQGTTFSSGADLSDLRSIINKQSARSQWFAIKNALNFIANFPLPTISMINGACIGGACLLALATDIRIASNNSTFSIPIARMGIILDEVNLARLVNTVGQASTKELLFSASTISSSRAQQIGLINQLVNIDSLYNNVMQLAKQITKNAPNTLSESKQTINKIMSIGLSSTSNQEESRIIDSYLNLKFET